MSLININSRNGFSVINKSSTDAEINIYEQIGESFFGDGVSARSFSEELKGLPSTVKNITVRINSVGGDVFDGITIYNRLKQHKAKVTVMIDGLAASIASVIALAGDEVVMGEGALMMIHKPMTGIYGNSIEMEETIQRLDDVEDQLVNIYRRKTGMDRTEIKSMLAAETWLDSTEAVEMGFADKTMESDEMLDIAASAGNAKWIKNKLPERFTNGKYVKKQLEGFKSEVEEFLAR